MAFAQEVRTALSKVRVTALQKELLRELARTPQTASELTTQLGLRHHVTVNRAFTDLGRSVRQYLSGHPDGLADGTYQQ